MYQKRPKSSKLSGRFYFDDKKNLENIKCENNCHQNYFG
jgi:hypothetical protein